MARDLELSGRVSDSGNRPVAGAWVELLDPDTDAVIAREVTNASGDWRMDIRVADEGDLVARLDGARAKIRVRGAAEHALVTRAVALRTDRPLAVPTKLSAAASRQFKPGVPLAPRETGSPMQPDGLALIDQAIHAMFPGASATQARYMQAARCPLPPFSGFDGLLDDAWGVLVGLPDAERRFRTAVGMVAGKVDRKRPNAVIDHGRQVLEAGGLDERGFQALLERPLDQPGRRLDDAPLSGRLADHLERFRRPGALGGVPGGSATSYRMLALTPHPDRIFPAHPCLFPMPRVMPLYLAAFRAARSFSDAAWLVGGVEHGLCGVGPMNRLLDAALRGLETGRFGELGGLLGFQAGECGPDDGPVPPYPEPHPDPCPRPPGGGLPGGDICLDERYICLDELLRKAPFIIGSRGSAYRIDAISPISACPGTEIVIRGSNFGETPGEVCFPNSQGRGRICVDATTWSSSNIRVTVPEQAGSGELHLRISDGSVSICGNVLHLERKGTGARAFLGGQPAVRALAVDGRAGSGARAEPGTSVTLSWSVNGGGGAGVRLQVIDGTIQRLDQTGLPDSGTLAFAVPSVPTERMMILRCTATNACGTVTRDLPFLVSVIPQIGVVDMEITQGIQRFWRTGVVWNSLDTIAGKDTIVRAYVSCNRNGFMNDQARITGSLRVGGVDLAPINGITPNSTSGNPFIDARPEADIDREQTDHTLNFRIPASLCTGTRTLRLDVWTEQEYAGDRPGDWLTRSRTWRTEPALRVRFVRIRDNRPAPDGTGLRPTAAQCRFTVERGFDLLPSPPTDIGPAWEPTWDTTRDFTDDDDLGALLADLDDHHNCNFWEWLWQWTGLTDCPDDDEAYWVGMTTPFNRGMAYRPGNTCLSAIYTDNMGQGAILRIKTAHELGHNLSFRHVNRTCSGTIGGQFYDHPNNGDLQDVPFDPYWNEAIGGSVQDFMSYGCTRWVSADSWVRLQGEI